ncbi:hypothetical protein E2F43_01390 [Seongchinamella unica]|jgi:predicted lipoprotein with Yx(FWY)xxD motif|uniref:Uncharacterized protein n=1 Tax=Seongchinamella unica TaxID=2547392 RepID=A0A4R5LU51_9GAMM|nr:hypothetical protein [Seongchinamella unica]TDG14926.1 hypothetical protein E2F43_01390 [Seongchinamella unica]
MPPSPESASQLPLPPPTPVEISLMSENDHYVFRTETGQSLYVRTADRTLESTCGETCLRDWSPLAASGKRTRSVGDWDSFTGVDGKLQWAYRGKPVYTYRAACTAPPESIPAEHWQLLQP